MSPSILLLILLTLASFAYMQGKRRAFSLTGPEVGSSRLHSRPGYYGMLTALWCVLPPLIVFAFWMAFSDSILIAMAMKALPNSLQELSADQTNLLVNNLRNLIAGHVAARDIDPILQQVAEQYIGMERISQIALGVVMLVTAVFSMSYVYRRIRPEMRARNHVERIVQISLVLCSTIAILTT
ncbi:MAG: phosphate ABC transporter permease family protein, partial [Proteobacteria bacterium]|nr:phosphate ABC transporter permease family protein [Pseudomonadota bacterium]